jgi:hypothetical protein
MIVTLLAWVYFLCMFYIYGFNIVKLITYSKDNEATKEISPFLLVFIGLSVVTIISYYLSFFIPINASANAILLGGMIILLFFSFKEIHQKLKNYILVFKVDLPNILLILVAVMILLLVLIKTSTDVIHYDTGLYHAQSIQWYRRYAIVPGLGNIHFRLAYNSLIFPLFSLSDFSFITHHSLRPINGFIIANTFLLSLSSLKSLLLKKIELSNVFGFSILLFLINDNLFTSDISSLSSDLSGSIFILISVFLSLKYIESKIKDESKLYELLIILFSSIAVTVKLSNLPIFILTILIISRSLIRKQYSLLWRGTIIVTLIFVPYLIRNYFVSGYLLYPFYSIDLFNPDWKMPRDVLIMDKQDIENWAKVSGHQGKKIVESGFISWLPVWFKENSKYFSLRFLFFSSILLIFFLIFESVFYRQSKLILFFDRLWIPLITLLAGLSFWFLNAPLVRYGYGFILSLSCLFISLVLFICLLFLRNNYIIIYKPFLYLLVFLFTTGLYLNNKQSLFSIPSYWLIPASYPTVSVTSIQIDHETIYRPIQGDQCWDSQFPCAPQSYSDWLHPSLELRGDSLQEGFKIKKGLRIYYEKK